MNAGQLDEALADANRSLGKIPRESEEPRWKFTVLKAEIRLRQRKSTECLKLLEGAPPPALAGSESAVWRKLTQGIAFGYLGRFTEAERALNDAESLGRDKYPQLMPELWLRQGTVAMLQDLDAKAQEYYSKSLKGATQLQDSFLKAAAMGSLGFIAAKRQHYDESLRWNREALALSESIGAQTSVARILGNMGWNYFELGDYDNALDLFEKAERSSSSAAQEVSRVRWKINASAVETYLRHYELAEKESLAALQIARNFDEKQPIIQCLDNLTHVALAQAHIDAADRYNGEASEIAEESKDRPGQLAALYYAGQIYLANRRFDEAEKSLSQVIYDSSTSALLRWEAQTKLAKVYAAEQSWSRADQEFQRAADTVETARDSVRNDELRLAFLTNATTFYDDYVDFLVARGRIEDALHVADGSRSRTLIEGLSGYPRSAAGGRHQATRCRAEDSKATCLTYWIGVQHSYLWLISPSGAIHQFNLPPEDDIERYVRDYRGALVGPRDPLELGNSAGQELYKMLVAPAANLIPKNSRVVILPDGALYGLNFETLLVPEPKLHYWIDDVTVSNASSLLLMASAAKEPKKPVGKGLLLIGNAISADPEFPPLPQAAPEMKEVEEDFPATKRTVLSGAKATAAAYLDSDPGKFSYIHFVAHGTANRTSPLDSAIILSKDGESFKLYARDVVTRPLHADLVTISSCYGAGSKAYAGEGLVGLSWAFLRAGAHNVIGALWEASDLSTPELMNHLYENLNHGDDPAAALHKAKLALLHSDSAYKKPYYWASFQLYSGL